jgi:hypothetical protein
MAGHRPIWTRRRARRIEAVLATAALIVAGLTAASLAGAWAPPARAQDTRPQGCTGETLPPPPGSPDPLYFAAERYPGPGLPRAAAPSPYAIPFAGYMQDGTLTVGTGNLNVLGPSIADLCGTFSLPSNTGTSTPEQLYIHNPVPVHAGSVTGPIVFDAYIQVTATITSQIAQTPGRNGGLDLTLTASFAGTLVPAPQGVEAPPSPALRGLICTTLVGPITFTTGLSIPPPPYQGKNPPLQGQPVTGPIDDASTYVVANDFPYPAVNPSTPASSTTPQQYASLGCNQTGAAVINGAGGLPQPPGNATFTAHAIFAVHVPPGG